MKHNCPETMGCCITQPVPIGVSESKDNYLAAIESQAFLPVHDFIICKAYTYPAVLIKTIRIIRKITITLIVFFSNL